MKVTSRPLRLHSLALPTSGYNPVRDVRKLITILNITLQLCVESINKAEAILGGVSVFRIHHRVSGKNEKIYSSKDYIHL